MKILLLLISLLTLASCGNKTPEPAKVSISDAAQGKGATPMPDVGKIEQVSVKTDGAGVTPGAAINDALKNAITQVNGVQVATAGVNSNSFEKITAALDVETQDGRDVAKVNATIQSQDFLEQIVSRSQGVVSSFRVIRTTAPSDSKGLFKVSIEAKIAKFSAPGDAGKIKIVVAPLRSNKAFLDIGGRQVPANEVLDGIRQQIIDTLSQTGRFTILDRQFDGEINDELDMISSGQAVNTDFAKLGQALTADLIWVGVVNDLSYTKNTRKLQMTDRPLIGYSGGWSVSQRLINLATRQVMQSNTLQGTPPPISPTTLGAKFDEASTLKNIQSEIVKKSAEAILLRTFPISIVERDGNNVVLSQGGQVVSENSRYRVYWLGKEIKDPQTGQSLGNMENPCCEVVVNRVTPKVSYGVLENVTINLNGVKPGTLQLREAIPAPKPVVKKSDEKGEAGTPHRSGKKKAGTGGEKDKHADDW